MIRNEAKDDIFSFKLSKDGDKKCGVWLSMGFETFEIIVLVTLALTLAYKMGKKHMQEKRMDSEDEGGQKNMRPKNSKNSDRCLKKSN